ncbi:hypothetical protein HK096_008461 [Nowakowskiella sp. JEL0078]|nr:hypothetical protein HK096_008461 [Nowakowskiella sp. JEL0078]
MRTFGTLKAIWANATESQPLSLQDLFNTTYRTRTETNYSTRPKSPCSEIECLETVDETENIGDEPQSSFIIPEGEVLCGCIDHQEKKEIDIVFQISAKKLFNKLFDERINCFSFWDGYHKKSGHSGLKMKFFQFFFLK